MKKAKNKAFTLLELLMALGILVIAILAVLSCFINCLFLNESNNNLVIAANDAQYVLEKIKALPYDSIAGYTPPVFNHLNNEAVSLSDNHAVGLNLWEVAVDVSWAERQRSRNFTLSTRIVRQ